MHEQELDAMITEIAKQQEEIRKSILDHDQYSATPIGRITPDDESIRISFQEFKYLTHPDSKVKILTKLRSKPTLEKGFKNIAKRLENVNKQKQLKHEEIAIAQHHSHSPNSINMDSTIIQSKPCDLHVASFG